MPKRLIVLHCNCIHLLVILFWELVLNVWAPVAPDFLPPNIYKWIEENAHICTIVPTNGEDLVNFLSVEEGLKCALCPELKPKEIPTMACAVEVSPNDVDVEIGCHPVPELCILELKNRYAEFYLGSAPGPEGPPGGPPGPPGENGKPGGNSPGQTEGGKRSEEEIFQATENVFSENPNGVTAQINAFVGVEEEEEEEEIVVGTEKREEEEQEEMKEVLDIIRGRQTTSTTTTTTISPTTGIIPLTTVRASFFSPDSPQVVPINLSLQNRARTSLPLFPHGPPGGGEAELPMEMANGKGGETQMNIQKRVEENSDEMEEEEKCKDSHELCCFWAISGECDGNPFWMRVKCPMTCGTCGCLVKNADKCKSIGVKCVLPKSSTSTTPTTIVTAPQTSPIQTDEPTSPTPPSPSTTTGAQERRRTRPIPPARMPGHRPQRPKQQQRTSQRTTTSSSQKMVAMTKLPLVSGDWSAVDFGDYENEMDAVEDSEGGGGGRGQSGLIPITQQPHKPMFVVLGLSSSTGYPDDEQPNGVDDIGTGKGGGVVGGGGAGAGAGADALDQTVPTEPAIFATESTTFSQPLMLTTSRETCFNYHKLCDFWAKMGECSNNPFWMRPHCQRACHSCGETLGDISTPQPRPGCTNEHILCPFWAFIGECGRNPRWMGIHCVASCQLC